MKIYLICEKVEDSLTKRDTTLPKKKKSKKKKRKKKIPMRQVIYSLLMTAIQHRMKD
jgi:hypothetical protein